MPFVVVTWIDAMRGDESVEATQVISCRRETVGWLLRDDREGVLVAMSKDDQGDKTIYERWFGIPRRYVESVRKPR